MWYFYSFKLKNWQQWIKNEEVITLTRIKNHWWCALWRSCKTISNFWWIKISHFSFACRTFYRADCMYIRINWFWRRNMTVWWRTISSSHRTAWSFWLLTNFWSSTWSWIATFQTCSASIQILSIHFKESIVIHFTIFD